MKKPITEINYKSDFDFILKFKGSECKCQHKENGDPEFPSYDFIGEIWPEKIKELQDDFGYDWERISQYGLKKGMKPYVFSQKEACLTNCINDKGRIHVVVDNHELPAGKLILVLTSYIPNPLYPDGSKKITDEYPLNIELVEGRGDTCVSDIDVEVSLPFVYITAYELAKNKGYKGTEEEFIEDMATGRDLIVKMSEEVEGIKEDWENRDKEIKSVIAEWERDRDGYLNKDSFEDWKEEELKEIIDEVIKEIGE